MFYAVKLCWIITTYKYLYFEVIVLSISVYLCQITLYFNLYIFTPVAYLFDSFNKKNYFLFFFFFFNKKLLNTGFVIAGYCSICIL